MNENKDRRIHERVPYQEFAELQEMPSKRTDVTKPSMFIQISRHFFPLPTHHRIIAPQSLFSWQINK
jgi:hypothetical protein